MNSINNIVSKFRDKKLKITHQRLAIFHSIINNSHHPSVEDIYDLVKVEHPSISLTTVYKTLEKLCQLGEIDEVLISKDRIRYDPVTKPHHHFMCLNCQSIKDLPYSFYNKVDTSQLDFGNHAVKHHKINFFGYCGKCKRIANA